MINEISKKSRLWDLEREDQHMSHSDKNKELDALPIKLASQIYYRRLRACRIYIFSLKIIDKNIHKNILEILDQNCISI